MRMVWDEHKREENRRVHGLDFPDARDRFEWDTSLVQDTPVDGQMVICGAWFFPCSVPKLFPPSACVPRVPAKGSSMPSAKRAVPAISSAEEARIQAGITADPGNSEITATKFAQMRPASEVLPPALHAALSRPRGRPQVGTPKVPVTLRLDASVVEAFKASGKGWQTRINSALVRALKLKRTLG